MEDVAAAQDKLQRLNEFGVSVSIDDFGTGYSSLRWRPTTCPLSCRRRRVWRRHPTARMAVDRGTAVGAAARGVMEAVDRRSVRPSSPV